MSETDTGLDDSRWYDTAESFVYVGKIMKEQNLLSPDEEADTIAHKEALAAAREEAMDEETDDNEDVLE
jgi:hypothetical protein